MSRIGDSQLFERRMDAVKSLIEYIIVDIQNQISIRNSGWRVVEFDGDTINFLNQLNAIQRRGNQIRLNINNHNIDNNFPTLKKEFIKLKYFIENRMIMIEDRSKLQKLNDKLNYIERNYQGNFELIISMIGVGIWKMFSFSGLVAPIDVIIENGLSPKKWAITSYKSIKFLTEDLLSNLNEEFRLENAFISLIEARIINNAIELEDIDEELLLNIVNILNWAYIKDLLNIDIISYLGLSWFIVHLSDTENLMPSYTDKDIHLSNYINQFIETMLDVNAEEIYREFIEICTYYENNGLEWAIEFITIPEVF